MHVLIVIPARVGSSRIARKPLAPAGGHPLIWHTVKAAKRVVTGRGKSEVVVATNSPEIVHAIGQECRTFLSSESFWCGSQRAAAVAQQACFSDSGFVINWQVDEPFVQPGDVASLLTRLGEKTAEIGTLVTTAEPSSFADKNRVKVEVVAGECTDFSRTVAFDHEHVGVYGFRVARLRDLVSLDPCQRSQSESLEQLSWLGRYRIAAVQIDHAPLSINTPADLEEFRRHCQSTTRDS